MLRPDKQMNVFRHENKGREAKLVIDERLVDAFGKQLSPTVVGQQRQAMEARKSQFVAVAWTVIMANGFELTFGVGVHARDFSGSYFGNPVKKILLRQVHRRCATGQRSRPVGSGELTFTRNLDN